MRKRTRAAVAVLTLVLGLAAIFVLPLALATWCELGPSAVALVDGSTFVADTVKERHTKIVGNPGTRFEGDLWDKTESLRSNIQYEVLDLLKAVRVTVNSMEYRYSGTSAKQNASFDHTIRLSDLTFVARREGGEYVLDPETLASRSMDELDELQAAYVRRYLNAVDVPPGTRLSFLTLHGHVRVGSEWKPPKDILQVFGVAEEPHILTGPAGARMRLTRQSDELLALEGDLTYGLLRGEGWHETRKAKWLIDAATKVCTQERISSSGTYAWPYGKDTFTFSRSIDIAWRPGFHTPASLPAGYRAVGWAVAGSDSGNYRDKRETFSIALPPGYEELTPVPPGCPPNTKHAFVHAASKGLITIGKWGGQGLVQIDQEAKARVDDWTNRGAEAMTQEAVTLPGRIPAKLLTFRYRQQAIAALLAADWNMVLWVQATLPPDDQAARDAAEACLKSYRVLGGPPWRTAALR